MQRFSVRHSTTSGRGQVLDEVCPDGMSRAELILRFTLSHPHCHTTIVGTCNDDHLLENLASAGRGPLPTAVCEEVQQARRSVVASASVVVLIIDKQAL